MEWLQGLMGGVLIGAAAALFLYTHGRIAGISGVLGGALRHPEGWRLSFLAGLVAGGAVFSRVWPEHFTMAGLPGWPLWIVSGLLVGIGTRVGGGCTSGHGVCGLGRGSPRSLVATVVFMSTAILTVLVRP